MHLPADLGGRVQKHMPKPFARPSIDLGGGSTSVKREWKWVPATDIMPGDTVPGLGIVTHVDERIETPAEGEQFVDVQAAADAISWKVDVRNDMVGTIRTFEGEERVWVFAA